MLKVTCDCGAAFAAKPELAGKRLACPACQQMLQVPDPPRAAAGSLFVRTHD